MILHNYRYLPITALVVILDQITKLLAVAYLPYQQQHALLSFFNLTLTHNEGAAFGFLSEAGGWQRWFFASLAIVVTLGIVYWLRQIRGKQAWLEFSLCLVLGGALGNLFDRIYHGHVIDFLQVHYHNWYFPTFNVADTAITLGAFLLLVSHYKQENS
jgi:signal peptidase II